jgi:hypothetical protein
VRDDRDDVRNNRVSDEQLRYATWLARGTTFGFAAMALGFIAYVIGVLEPHVAFEDLPSLWSIPAASYVEAAGIPEGWGWLALTQKADMLNLVGIAMLSGCSVVALLAVIPVYTRQRNRIFVGVCIVEIAIMVLAASNVLAAGH